VVVVVDVLDVVVLDVDVLVLDVDVLVDVDDVDVLVVVDVVEGLGPLGEPHAARIAVRRNRTTTCRRSNQFSGRTAVIIWRRPSPPAGRARLARRCGVRYHAVCPTWSCHG
jgi:hypothetical protein